MFYVYVLISTSSCRLYKGFCSDLKRRLAEHNAGKTQSTKPFIPWEIAYYEKFNSFTEAIIREKFFKTSAGRKFLKKVL